MSARNVIAEALDLLGMDDIRFAPEEAGDSILDALAGAGYAVVDAAERQRDLAAVAEWQRSALRVIEAANAFLLDTVTGDGNPTALAGAIVEGGFEDRFPEALADAGWELVKRPEPQPCRECHRPPTSHKLDCSERPDRADRLGMTETSDD